MQRMYMHSVYVNLWISILVVAFVSHPFRITLPSEVEARSID